MQIQSNHKEVSVSRDSTGLKISRDYDRTREE